MLSITHFSESRFKLSRRAVGPLFCVLFLFYFGFHTVSGDRGLFALFKETRRLEALQTELVAIKAKREALESKVGRLSSHSLDLDMLDEQARSVVGLAGKDEVVIFTPAE